jgi:hypothetical protein
VSGIVTRDALVDFVGKLDSDFARPGRLLLIGETTHVAEGWRDWTTQIEFWADVSEGDRKRFDDTLHTVQSESGLTVINQSPAELIPLPDGYDRRARPCRSVPTRHLTLHHFDPYSASFRYIARGDEPDYHIVLMYLDKGWITFDEMDDKLDALLPRFTSETIQQDPAEFKRKYKGLLQMYQSIKPRTTHRPTAV